MYRKIIILIIYLLITFPTYKALRHPWMISGHDSNAAIFKGIELKNAIIDNHFPVRWSKRLDFGLGLPTFTFTYNLPYYLTATLSFLGLDIITAEKLIMAISFPLSAFFTYIWVDRYFKLLPSFVGGLLYTMVPYHFLNVYVRFAIGEVVASTLLPLVFILVDRLIETPSPKNVALCGTGIAGLILSHQFYGLIFIPLWIIYVFMREKRKVLWIIFSVFIGIMMTSYYSLPMFAYKQYTHLDNPQEYFLANNNFLSFEDLWTPRWGFGDLKTQNDNKMSLQIGVVHILLLALSLILIIFEKNNKNKRPFLFFWGILGFSIFMTQSISLPIWKMFPILQNIQFPWRLMAVVVVMAIYPSVYLLNRISSKGLIIFVGLLLFIAYSNYWRVDRYSDWEDKTLVAGGWPGTLTMLLEETPKWHNIRQEPNPYHQSQVSQGKAIIKNLIWKTNYHQFSVEAEMDSVISDKTHFWPGWSVFVDGNKVSLVDPYDTLSQGLITFRLSPGSHIVEVKLLETPLEKIADFLSIGTLLVSIYLLFLPYRRF